MDDSVRNPDPDEELDTYIVKCVKDFESEMSEWATEAWENYDFLAGRQYTSAELDALKNQLKPSTVFNFIEKFLSIVGGTEITNQMIPRYYPSAASRSGPVDAISELIKEFLDEDIETEHSDSFLDTLISGYGWINSYLCEEYGYYRIKEERISPFEMGWDPFAKKPSLKDARYIYHREYMTISEIEAEWPDKIDEVKVSYDLSSKNSLYVEDEPREDYARSPGIRDYRGKICVIKFQWYQKRRFVVFTSAGQSTHGEQTEIDKRQFNKAKTRLEKMGNIITPVREYSRKVYYQAYFCRGVVIEGPTEIPSYTYHPSTGKRDESKGYFYGLFRSVKDPQRWTNKFLANVMHVMSTSGKGVFAEVNAVAPRDRTKFEEDYARPDKVKWLADGALSQGKIKPMDPTPLPVGLTDLLEFAVNSVPNTIGINVEMMGLNQRTQSGPVESSRKKAGLVVLAKFFQARRKQIQSIGLCRLWMVQEYIPEEQLFELLSDENKPYFQGTQLDPFRKYYTKVDEIPSSGDVKEDVWQIIVELIPYLMNQKLPPQFMVTLLRYSPLPTHITDELAKIVAQPNPNSAVEAEKVSSETIKNKAQAILDLAKAANEGGQQQLNPNTIIETLGELKNKEMEMKLQKIKTGGKIHETLVKAAATPPKPKEQSNG